MDVARDLIGKVFVKRIKQNWVGGIIVETEAYLAEGDEASHSSRGETASNGAMFQAGGTIYVYPIHTHHCFNIVTERRGRGCAVLIRAIQPVWGIDLMLSRRNTQDIRKIARGPGCLCQALEIDRRHDQQHLHHLNTFRIASTHQTPPEISATGRIGITRNADLLLRFFWDSNWYVSGRHSDHRQKPTHPLSANGRR